MSKNKTILSCLACVGLAGLQIAGVLLAPKYLGQTIDQISSSKDFTSSLILLAVFFVMACVGAYLLGLLAHYVARSYAHSLRQKTVCKINSVPANQIERNFGNLLSRISIDIEAVVEGVFHLICTGITAPILMAGCIACIYLLDIRAFLIILCAMPLVIIYLIFVSTYSAKYFMRRQQAHGDYAGFLSDALNMRTVFLRYGYTKKLENSHEQIASRLQNDSQNAMWFSSLVNPGTRFLSNLVYVFCGTMAVLGILTSNSGLSQGAVASILLYTTAFAKPLNEFTAASTQLIAARAARKRVLEFLALAPEKTSGAELANATGDIKFDDISFSYDSKPLIENFSLEVPAGSKVAIVGRTGAGKTTLVNLLTGFLQPNAGKILLDGQDIAQLDKKSLRAQFAYVLQDSWIFGATIAQNISFYADMSDKQIQKAAKEAHAHDLIMRMGGYDTVISQDFAKMSDGEKQLICLARAFAKNAPMLIFDEATRAIDSRTELLISHAVSKLSKNKTAFFVAHRLSTIKDADIILAMDGGKIVEQGNHAELMQKQGFYYTLYAGIEELENENNFV